MVSQNGRPVAFARWFEDHRKFPSAKDELIRGYQLEQLMKPIDKINKLVASRMMFVSQNIMSKFGSSRGVLHSANPPTALLLSATQVSSATETSLVAEED